ncbi:MAG TPA: hypothetical protein VKN64_11160 [Halanaerobiales bacterium]|nr:hypothetical protein [Halanaerobiales bacterium]
MSIYINDEKTDLETTGKDKEKILKKIKGNLNDEIIDRVYLDEVEVSLAYFKENNINSDKIEKINFVTKKNEILIKETLILAKKYLTKLENALIQTAQLYENYMIYQGAEKLDKCLSGLEWYTEVTNSIYNLIDKEIISDKGKELLDKLHRANTRAMVALQKEDYQYFSDIIEVKVVEVLDELDVLNDSILNNELK